MKVTVLGSGTSSGVPTVGCFCPVCTSTDPRDKRRRASLLIESNGHVILIDTGPDLRDQLLSSKVRAVHTVLLTHYHFDHIGGLDDLRPLSYKAESAIPCYVDTDTAEIIQKNMPHVNAKPDNFYGPRLNCIVYPEDDENHYAKIQLGNCSIQPIKLFHVEAINMYSVGFVINKKFAYLTDFKKVMPGYEDYLYGLDTMYIGAPLPHEHPTHQSHQDAMELFAKYKPEKGYIGHLAHTFSHQELLDRWPKHIKPAYDGLELNFS